MPATRQSWTHLQPLPAIRAALSLQREFSEQEFEQIRLGLVPERMEDRWFMFVEADTLYVHRSWTGHCIYQLRFIKEGTKYVAGEAFANRDKSQYSGSDDRYDEKLLLYLIDYLLLKKRSPSPMGMSVPAGVATELHYHHIIGAGSKAEAGPIHVTLGGALKWLGRWLLWLVRR